MKVHDIEQYSPEWYALHLGKPSTSKFHLIITPKALKPTSGLTRNKYKWRLVAERILNQPLENMEQTEWMERGLELEPKAASAFEFLYGKKLLRVGLITTDDGRIIASPDRLIEGENGGVEIKCKSPTLHVGFMDKGFGDGYNAQRLGQLWVSEWDIAYGFAYNPYFPHVDHVIRRDDETEKKITAIYDAVMAFADEVDALHEKVKAMGYYEEHKRPLTPHELALGEIIMAG